MRAMIVNAYGAPDVLKRVDMDIPEIQPDEVLVRVIGTSVNYADIKARYGRGSRKALPFVPGLDATGVIEQVGGNVQHLEVGQRVISFPSKGSYAEYIAADATLTFAIPDKVDFETAAACPIVSFTAYKLLADVARIQPGESVLIHAAAGGIGTTAIQLAKLLGAGTVIGTVGSEAKAEIALAAGANHVIPRETTDWCAQVMVLTNGQGADVILDSISGKVGEDSLRCLAMYGRLVNFGNASGEAAAFETSDLYPSCRSVLGYSLGATRGARPADLQRVAPRILEYLASGQLKMNVGRRYPLEEAALAHAWVESRQSIGKVLLSVAHSTSG